MLKRLWDKIKVGEPDECWEWQAYKDYSGYGKFRIKGKSDNAHRVVWAECYGPIPDGLYVLHKCDNRSCCNPLDLFLGTPADNMADMWNKGREKGPAMPGERNAFAKLTEQKVQAIRSDPRRHKVIAAEYGISRSHVTGIKSGAFWKRLPVSVSTGHVNYER